MATVVEIGREVFGAIPERIIWLLAWENTGYPDFFATNDIEAELRAAFISIRDDNLRGFAREMDALAG